MIRVAVIGVGYLGKFHAQKYTKISDSELIGIVDLNMESAQKISSELNVPFHTDYREIVDKVDAVSIVVPTIHHYRIAKDFLKNGVHVLLEKPFASKIEEAEELEKIANEKDLCLQIGHLERFNPVFTKFKELIKQPKFIENVRIAPFTNRGADVDVILDLMIHDIDLIL